MAARPATGTAKVAGAAGSAGSGTKAGAAASVAGNGGSGPAAAGAGGTEDGWRRRVMLHLERRKRFPPGGTDGTVRVTFTIDRSGNVLSARIARPAANGALNREAEKLLKRASPLPAPPPDVGSGATLTLTVPLIFER
ncbi:energy transducer TonB [Pseudoxanthobacter sp.]|uniref:energy transducer TonB family protein n=1 Tax=Pseudoxanthobacter sp. TaxID=1925742 RepID=UPI002FE3A766